MPHSSGGGSSSGSSSSSSSSSSGGGSHSMVRKNYYQGSSRYVYYSGGTPHYFYSDGSPSENKQLVWGLGFILPSLIILFFVAFGVAMIVSSIIIPTKTNGAINKEILILDKAEVIDNENELMSSLQTFADKTGIIPIIVTADNKDWMPYYEDMEAYAYDLYLNSCDDEYHWLIVYTEAKNHNLGFNDWHWHGMQGDYTDNVLNSAVLDKFNDALQNGLIKKNTPVGVDFKNAFDLINPTLMKPAVEWVKTIFGIIWIAITGSAFFAIIQSFVKSKNYASAEKIPLSAKEETCECCGGKYVMGNMHTCPHCGAAILFYADTGSTVLNGENIAESNWESNK